MTFQPALVTEEHPLEIREQVSPEVLALDEPTAKALQPVDVEITVQKDEENFIVYGWARTTLQLLCARDGELFPQPVRAKVEHVFEGPHPATIDLTPFIREDILLEIPLNAVCQLQPGGRCPVTHEIYKPRKADPAPLIGQEVWDELSKLKPSKLKPKK
jgi:uncharacterized protein